MPSERTLIEVAARALCVRRRNDPDFGYPGKPNSTLYVDDALAMLRALHDHGPTQRMLDAASKLESDCARLNYGGTPSAEDLYSAMLAAELEDRQ